MEGNFEDPDIGGHGFDLVLCNPPYIPLAEINGLAREVTGFDPLLALDGGDDGLASWRRVMPRIADGLAPGGRAFVEIGADQQAQVTAIAMAAGLQPVDDADDMAGIVRCLVFAASE